MATKTKIVCPKCKAKLKFDPDKIISEVVKFKCPGCGSSIGIRKPDPREEVSSSSATSQSEPKIGSDIEKPNAKCLAPGSKTTSGQKQHKEYCQADTGKNPEPATEPEITADVEKKIPAAPDNLSGKPGALFAGDNLVDSNAAGKPLLEEIFNAKLKEFEVGEAEAGDLEWTRYADKKDPIHLESKIDLNVLPASATGLQETLAGLQQAETYNLQGEVNLGKNLINQAIRDFNHALEINPDYVDALVNRGSAYVLQSKYDNALKDFNHALDLEKRQAQIYNIRGEIYLLEKIYDLAIKDFSSAIILNPMYSDAYLNRAKAYSEKGMLDEAEIDYNQAIKAAPDTFTRFVDLEDSEELFDEDCSSDKEKAAKFMQQGMENLKSEKHYEAVESFTRAINLSSKDAIGYIQRGQAYVELNQPDEAMVDLNRAVLFDPFNPALYYWRAMAWKALDSPINMIADFKLSCELGYEPACMEYIRLKPQKN